MKKGLKKLFKIAGLTLTFLLLLMLILPVVFPKTITDNVKQLANKSINGKFDFRDVSLSFFSHFPNLTVSLYDFSILGSVPYQNDTLITGKELSLGLDLLSLFREQLIINKIYLVKTDINILIDKNGYKNFDIYTSSTGREVDSISSSTSGIDIKSIIIKNSNLVFTEESNKLILKVSGLDYRGSGKIMDTNFDLKSYLLAKKLDLSYGGTLYLKQQNIEAKSITGIDAANLKFELKKNHILVNNLPVNYTGEFIMYKDGYDVDFSLFTKETSLHNFFTILPPEYSDWLKNTKIKGKAQMNISLKGAYRDSINVSPSLSMDFIVKNGSINHAKVTSPVENINIVSRFEVPSLDPQKLICELKTLSFTLNNQTTQASLLTKGLKEIDLKGEIVSKIDIDLLSKAIGLSQFKFGGKLSLKASANGVYSTEKKIIPQTNIEIELIKGDILTPFYPNPIEKIDIKAAVTCKTGKLMDLKVDVSPISFVFENNPFIVQSQLFNFEDLTYKISAKGALDLDRIYKVFAIEKVSVNGKLTADLSLSGNQSDLLNGRYDKLDNKGSLTLSDFRFNNSDYPYPFLIPQATIAFDKEKAILKNMQFVYNNNNFKLDGYMKNYIAYYMFNDNLEGSLSISAPKIVVEDFLNVGQSYSKISQQESSTQSQDAVLKEGVLKIPQNLNLSLKAGAKAITYSSANISDFTGELKVSDGALKLTKTKFNLAGAIFNISAGYKPLSNESADFEFKARADSFNVKKAYNEIDIFKEMAPSAASAEGIVSAEYTLKGKLDKKMDVVYPTIKGKGFIKLENIRLKGHRILGAISKASGKDSINNPNLKAVIINSSVQNNVIKIERTKMRVFGFRLRFEGQTSLNGKLNISFRIGLPPLGLIGIPMTITGSVDKPVVNMRKGKEADKLEEQEAD